MLLARIYPLIAWLGCVAATVSLVAVSLVAEQLPADDKAASDPTQLFLEQVAPIFERSCVGCHNAEKREGGLALDSAEGLTAGGDSGPVVLADDALHSPLLQAIMPDGSAPPAMPKGRPALSRAQVEALQNWISRGAPWPAGHTLKADSTPDFRWWSLEPLVAIASPSDSPSVRSRAAQSNNALDSHSQNFIDAFIAARQIEHGLASAPRATRRQLIRRATYDLIGLPPAIEEVEAFVADERPDAYERLIDRLLASPAYGERWARHWLDVAHYGETHGYDKDKMRLNAWPYRDYVIRSLNDDKPYDRFVAEQVAGDVLWPHQADAIEAVGFLSAGPWDFIGHAEVPESKLDGRIARHLDRDDMVQNVFLTFQSLTVGCAQCHDHKFDPISQREYYGLQAVFAALDRADRAYYRDPHLQARFTELKTREQRLRQEQDAAQQEIARAGGEELARIDKRLKEASSASPRYPAEHGYHSAIASSPDALKWVQVDLGQSIDIARIEWIACHDDFAGIGDGFGGPRGYRIELSSSGDFSSDRRVVHQTHDATNPGIALQAVEIGGQSARYVRFIASQLAERQKDYIFALAELRVLDAAGENVALNKPVSALDSIEALPRWSRSNLVDGKYPRARSTVDIDTLTAERAAILEDLVPLETRQREQHAAEQLALVRLELKRLPPPQTAYVATIHHGQGAFSGTGPTGGRPRKVEVLPRGDVSQKGPEAQPTALRCIAALEPQLGTLESGDAERRSALARWLTDRANPLTWRSIANRVWSYHFHRGIVETPNDFGRMGGVPSHPELLDQLALEVRDGQSLKRLHRAILLSRTYQQSSQPGEKAADVDPQNRWLSHSPRKRLEAEAIRDAMLATAGLLRREMGGPSYQDFVIERPEHSPHYEYALHDPRDAATMRRSIYRFIVRSQTQPLMTSLDCADPSMQVDVRSQSNSATQALALLNNAFTLMAAEEWASRIERSFEQISTRSTERSVTKNWPSAIRKMFADALSREPTEEESQVLAEMADQYGLTAVARVIFNLNEFVYVD
ncbi:MAG: DUF1549 domain-containing protein [Aureliella sp.]